MVIFYGISWKYLYLSACWREAKIFPLLVWHFINVAHSLIEAVVNLWWWWPRCPFCPFCPLIGCYTTTAATWKWVFVYTECWHKKRGRGWQKTNMPQTELPEVPDEDTTQWEIMKRNPKTTTRSEWVEGSFWPKNRRRRRTLTGCKLHV